MSKFHVMDAEKYGGQGGGGYFSLKNPGDSARVRIMYDRFEDIECYAVHQVVIGGKKRFVDCLRSYDEPVDMCPMCKAGIFTQVKIFIPLYCVDEDRIKVWERGKTYIPKLKALFEAYAKERSLAATVFKITKTEDELGKFSFEIAAEYTGSMEVEDFEDSPSPVYGGLVLQKTAAELEHYLEIGSFE